MKKILIVEDEIGIRETISEILTCQNYTTKTAANGIEALEILKTWTPNLILSDINMPVMDGYSFFEETRKIEHLPLIPFVFLTAKAGEEEMRNSLTFGVDDFISKPFKADFLIQIIEAKIKKFKAITNSSIVSFLYNQHLEKEILTSNAANLNQSTVNEDTNDKEKEDDSQVLIKKAQQINVESNRLVQKATLLEQIKQNKEIAIDDEVTNSFAVFQEVLGEISVFHENAEKRILHHFDDEKIKIQSHHLSFILYELIDNALQFSRENGKVILSGKKNGNEFEITIRDFGNGFDLSQITKANINLDSNHKGLSVFFTKKIIQSYKGHFCCESNEKNGTIITIVLPLNENDNETLPLL